MFLFCSFIYSFEKIPSVHADILPYPDITLSINDEKFTLKESTYAEWVSPSFFLIPSQEPSSLAKTQLCLDKHPLCSLETSQRTAFHRSIKKTYSLNRELLTSFVLDLQKQSRKDPEDARFSLSSDNRVESFHAGSDGYQIQKEESLSLIQKELLQLFSQEPSSQQIISLTLPTEPIRANVTSSDAKEFGITSLIGEGRSDFSGSSNDRVFNVRFGMEKFHGVLVKPGEEFSFVEILGEVDEEHGWRPELVIRNNRTEPEYGGGICQVSTTLFRAAVFSGLQITMRQNHSYPVKYYTPIGFDASVYVPMPDFRFVNNTPGHILIQGRIEGKELIFSMYGTDDGRVVEVDTPTILEKNEDGTIKTVFTQKVQKASGELLLEKKFFSNYDNPDNYPKPEDIDLTEKPKDWSKRQWEEYKKEIEASLKNR